MSDAHLKVCAATAARRARRRRATGVAIPAPVKKNKKKQTNKTKTKDDRPESVVNPFLARPRIKEEEKRREKGVG